MGKSRKALERIVAEKRNNFTVPGFIRPLSWIEVEAIPPGTKRGKPTQEGLVRFVTDLYREIDLNDYVRAYDSVSEQDQLTPLLMAPMEPRIMTKLVLPLRHAKASYVLGNYLGTIALAGMIGEMVALLTNEIYAFERQLPNEEINTFEAMGQQQRIRTLRKRGAIAAEHVTALNRIKTIRNKYLHAFTQSHDLIMQDAGNAFYSAQALVAMTVFDGFLEGRVHVLPSFARYLERMGIVTRTDPPPTEQAGNPGNATKEGQ